MSDLKLVAPNQPTALERLLMNAAANESPSDEQRMRVRQALGLSAFTVPPPPVAHASRAAALGKAIGGVILASAVIGFVWSGIGHNKHSTPSLIKSLTEPARGALIHVARHPEPVASPLPPVELGGDTVVATKSPSKAGANVSNVSKPVAALDATDDLSEQLRLIDAARSAVAAGNTAAAAQALSSYGSRFPRGSFGQEAAVLRIETLDMQGNHAQAAALAKSFLARHPNSPHVGLVQGIAGRAQ